MSTLAVLSFVLAALTGTAVEAYPSGPPLSVCTSMKPTGHGASTLTGTTNPFTISTNASGYLPGDVIEVTISGAQFVGFFLQARRRDSGADMDAALGTLSPSNTVLTKTLNCGDGTANAWSHKTNAPKTSQTAIWTVPSGDEGTIAFRATIVQGPSSDRYWTDVYSRDIVYGIGGGDTTESGDGSHTPTPTGHANIIGSSFLLIMSFIVAGAIHRLGS